jgi:hypothetical protein
MILAHTANPDGSNFRKGQVTIQQIICHQLSGGAQGPDPVQALLVNLPTMSVARIYGSGRRSSSLDCLTSAQTQILAIATARAVPRIG